MYTHTRNTQVLTPYDSEDCRGLLKAAIRDPDPIIFLENEIMYGESFPVTSHVSLSGCVYLFICVCVCVCVPHAFVSTV